MPVAQGKSICDLEGCGCAKVRPPVFTREYVAEDPGRAAALLNHAYYAQVEMEKQVEGPK